jgi:hypothetical protein
MQIWLEPKRVLNYGMMPLFDARFHEPVAQGMITDKAHPYQSTNFSLWAISEALFGFLGLNLVFYRNVALFVVYAIFMAAVFLVIYYGSQFNTFTTWQQITFALGAIFPTIVGIGHFMRWIGSATRILMEPELLLRDGDGHGLVINPEVYKLINPYSESARKTMEKNHPSSLFESYTPAQIRRMFAIRTLSEVDNSKDCGNQDGPVSVFFAILEGVFMTVLSMVLSPLSTIKVGIWSAFTSILDAFKSPNSTQPIITSPIITPPTTTATAAQQGGGSDALSTESLVLGGTLIALVLGGMMKGAVEHFVPNA